MCNQLDTPSVVDLSLDMRRRSALQRTIEESRTFQDTLKGLTSVLPGGYGSDIQALVKLVQQNTNDSAKHRLRGSYADTAGRCKPSELCELVRARNLTGDLEMDLPQTPDR